MAYQGQTPWHKLGTRITVDVSTVADALRMGNLDYLVQLVDLYFADGTKVRDHRATVRQEGGRQVQLGVVGSTYTPVQNAEACAILDPLLGMGCRPAAMGALGHGERCWMLLRMPAGVGRITPVDGDDVNGYFLLHWSHDGSTGIIGLGTLIRVVCQNTLGMAVGAAQGKAWFTIRHTASASQRLDDAAAILAKLTQALKATGDTFARLAQHPMNAKQLAAYIEAAIPNTEAAGKPIAPVILARRDAVAQLTFAGKGADMANQLVNVRAGEASAWAAYNAVVEYFDHVRPGEAKSAAGRDRANESAIFGGNATLKAQAFTLARQLVAA
jgi:phage/plasmid-like protein (TIGR03299 family)